MDIDITLRNLDIIMPKNLTVKRWDWTITELYCNKSCKILIHLFCDEDVYNEANPTGYLLKTIEYKLEGDEYTNWGQDDNYITEICLKELEKLKA